MKAISENEEYIILSIFIFKLKRMKCKRESVSFCKKEIRSLLHAMIDGPEQGNLKERRS